MDRKVTDGIVSVIGIDIGKNTFHPVGLDERGSIVLRQKLSRGQVIGSASEYGAVPELKVRAYVLLVTQQKMLFWPNLRADNPSLTARDR